LNGEGVLTKDRFRVALLTLLLILGVGAPAALRTAAQETPTETAKRKVRSKVMPDYPELAKKLNVTGKVKVEATVAPDGHVTATRILGGSPTLVSCAAEALKKWRYEPGPKETTEVVEFTFSVEDDD
jgi:TonB family protein